MADFLQLVSMLREQASATISRSDILKPLSWLIALLVAAIIGCLWTNAETWILVTDIILLICSVSLYLISYIFCLFKNPDALRSEKYSLQKLAIEHRLIGDSETGVFDPSDVIETSNETTTKQIEQDK